MITKLNFNINNIFSSLKYFFNGIYALNIMKLMILILISSISVNLFAATEKTNKDNKNKQKEVPQKTTETKEIVEPTIEVPKINYKESITEFFSPKDGEGQNFQLLLSKLEQYFESEKQNKNAYYNAGLAAQRLTQYEKAGLYYDSAIKLDSSFAPAYYNIVSVYVLMKKYDLAEKMALEYLEKNPNDLKMMNNLAGAYVAEKKYDLAEKVLQNILIKEKNDPYAYRNLAQMYFEQGNYKMSQLLSANALKLSADDTGIINNVGVNSLKMNEPRIAFQNFKMAFEKDSSNLYAGLNLSIIALNSGDYQLAKNTLEVILKKYPGDISARIHYAIALRGSQEMDQAIDNYNKVLLTDPNNETALYNLSMVYRKYLLDFDKSIEIMEKYASILTEKQSKENANNLIETIKKEKSTYLEAKKIEEERLSKEKAEKERIAQEKAEKEKIFSTAKEHLTNLISLAQKKLDDEKATLEKDKQEAIKTAVDQSKMVLEQGDLEMLKEASSYLETVLK